LYFFGFSRGAYTTRFLAELIDHIGLLAAENEELVRFAWKTYAKWAARKNDGSEKAKREEEEQYEFMHGFRETFSRPVRRLRFLGLFDTVNSVPRFESAWLQRSKLPYMAKSSALTSDGQSFARTSLTVPRPSKVKDRVQVRKATDMILAE
jgi:uncharacterized protein (DUF2235 family)